MSLKLGDTTIAGVSRHTVSNAHTLLEFKWSDHLLNDVSWLRADTFSWQSGQVYSTAYNHLVADLSGATAGSETIAGITIEYVTATDGHKIVLPSQETVVDQIYQATGVAWYYIVDTTNQRFKLPRSKALTSAIKGTGMTFGMTNGTVNAGLTYNPNNYIGIDVNQGAYGTTAGSTTMGSAVPGINQSYGITTDSTKSGIVVERADTDQCKYLYFYVGEYSRSAVEQTAGLNSEMFNQKADKSEVWTPSSSTSAQKETIVGWGMPSEEYINITTNPYTAPADGYVYLQTNITKHGSVILQNETTGIKTYEHGSYEVSVNGYGYIPVRKGDVVSYANNTGYGYSVTVFRFHFAEGEK